MASSCIQEIHLDWHKHRLVSQRYRGGNIRYGLCPYNNGPVNFNFYITSHWKKYTLNYDIYTNVHEFTRNITIKQDQKVVYPFIP